MNSVSRKLKQSLSSPVIASAAVGALYFFAARVGLLLASVNSNASPVWPATGVAIVSLFVLGVRLWPAVAVAAFVANDLTGSPVGVNAAIAIGNGLEAVIGAIILQKMVENRSRTPFHFETIASIVVAFLASIISATIGNFALMVGGIIDANAMPTSWLTWWTGDMLGALCIVPLALFIFAKGDDYRQEKGLMYWAGLVSLMAGIGVVSYGVFFLIASGPLLFLLLSSILVASLWRGAAAANLIAIEISVIGILATVNGKGPFVGGTLNENLIHLQLFLAAVALTGAILPGLVTVKGRRTVAIVSLVLGWLLSGAIFAHLTNEEVEKDQRRFTSILHKTEHDIDVHLSDYEDALRAGASLFAASDFVSRTEWRLFLSELNVTGRYPGINGLGVIFPVPAKDLQGFQRHQAKDLPGFKVHAPSPAEKIQSELAVPTARDQMHYVITYVEPGDINSIAMGLDISLEPFRRAAAELSRDSGRAIVTRNIKLVQDKVNRPGFLYYFPFYQKNVKADATLEQRRQGLRGWIYGAFVTEYFFSGIVDPKTSEIDLDIYEMGDHGDNRLIFSSLKSSKKPAKKPEMTSHIVFGGRDLEIAWRRSDRFLSTHDDITAWASFCATILGLLLAAILVAMRETNYRATALADERTHEIRRLEILNREYMNLVQGLQDYGIVILGVDGLVTSWNEGARILLGYDAHEVIGHSLDLFDVPQAKDDSSAKSDLASTNELGRIEVEGARIRKDRTRFLANIIYIRIDDEWGHHKGYSLLIRDVTRERHREQRQVDALTSLKLATSASKMGFFYIDEEANTAEYSQEMRQVLGLDLAGDRNINRAKFFGAIPESDRGNAAESFQRFYAGLQPFVDIECPFRSPLYGMLWIKVSAHASSRQSNGRPQSVVAYVQDITAQHIASERLENSERRLHYALEGSSDGLWDWDLLRKEIYVSDKLAARFGGPTVIHLDSPSDLAESIHPEDRERTAASIAKHLLGETSLHECEARLRMADGSWSWFLTRGKISERDAEGRPGRMTGVHIDISALKRAEQIARDSQIELERSRDEIIRQNSELRIAGEARSRFLATMSHEIRTPLNGVLGMTDLLSETPLNADQMDLLRLVKHSGATLLSLINDILDFSKIDAGKLQLESTSFDLARVVEVQVELMSSEAIKKNVSIQSYIDPEISANRVGDPGRISQVLLNLIGNAVKFTSKGSVQVSVRAVKESSQGVRFEISDTGIGLTRDQMLALFQPFKQADSSTSRKYGGTGLGLSICKGLVEAMDGRIGVDSNIGEGSTFWFEIHLPQSTLKSPKILPVGIDPSQILVYVVTENAFLAEVLCAYTRSWGITAEARRDFNGVQRSQDERFKQTIVIADSRIALESRSNFAEIKQKLAADEVKVLGLLSHAPDQRTALADLVDGMIPVPVSQSVLFDSLALALDHKKSLQTVQTQDLAATTPSSKRILVAEDNVINQVLAKRLLESLGYSCHIVENGREAIDAVFHAPYDLVLMDCHMPELDGYDATRQIRKLEVPGSRIPIVAVTANAMSGDETLCIEAGMDDYLTKPINKAALKAKLEKWLKEGHLNNLPSEKVS